MNFLSIKETCIYVADLEQTKNFYYGILGLPLISLVKNKHVFFRAGNSVLLCFISEESEKQNGLPPHGAHGTIHFAFEIRKEDYDATLQQIKNAGIVILHQHVWKNQLRSFYFHDPDNHLIEIIEQGVWD